MNQATTGARAAPWLAWSLWAFSVALTVLSLLLLVLNLSHPGIHVYDYWLGYALVVATTPAIPVSIGIAILRYRLCDIDRIINRTLVYGALTVTLAVLYFGGVTATQALLRVVTGQHQGPQLVVVASTLLIAALFSPLRRRIQGFIDRRFYRSKYDASRTLQDFSGRLRDETDLEHLNSELLSIIREPMQPEHVSLWLAPARGEDNYG
jgi:hypothetical protein